MNRKRVVLVAAITSGILAVIILLLVTGGDESLSGKTDPASDVSTLEGRDPPADTAIADLHGASVVPEGDELVFQARLGTNAPTEVPDGSLEFRWEIYEGGERTWLLTATISVDVQASMIAERTDYGSSTIDDTLPGSVEVDEKRVRITVQPGRASRRLARGLRMVPPNHTRRSPGRHPLRAGPRPPPRPRHGRSGAIAPDRRIAPWASSSVGRAHPSHG